MPNIERHEPGTNSWADLMTTDQKGAMEFYGALLGWEFRIGGPDTGGYATATLGGRAAAGIGGMPPGAEDGRPAWTTYFAVDDADKMVERITSAGGTVVAPPMTVIDGEVTHGRMAIVAAPSGAVFGLWQAGQHRGAGVVGEPGSLCWTEEYSRDAAAARAFYSTVFGWEFEQIGDGVDFDYTTAYLNGAQVAGVMQMNEKDFPPEVPSHWSVYIAVADADAALARVTELGGTVQSGDAPMDTPYGRIVVIADPQGGSLRVTQLPDQPPA